MGNYKSSITAVTNKEISNAEKSATSQYKKANNEIQKSMKYPVVKYEEKYPVAKYEDNRKKEDLSEKQEKNRKSIKIDYKSAIGEAGKFVFEAWQGYKELNYQLVKNQNITGATEEQQKDLNDQGKYLGKTSLFTAKEVAEAQMYQAMAGYKTNQILEATPTLLKLAAVSGKSLAETTTYVTENLSEMGLGLKDMGMYTDLLASLSTNSNVGLEKMGKNLIDVGGVSKNFGEDIREVGTMFGILSRSEEDAKKATAGLKEIYSKLGKDTPEMRKQLELTGTELKDQGGKFKGLRTIIEESREPLSKLTEEQRNLWLETVAGKDGMTTWQSILGATAEETKKAENASYNAAGSLNQLNQKVEDTDEGKIRKLSGVWEEFKNQLGAAASPLIIKGVEKLTEWLGELTAKDAFSAEGIEKFFNILKEEIQDAVQKFVAFYGTILLVRAAMGDPIAIGQLVGAGVAGTMFLIDKFKKRKDSSKQEISDGKILENIKAEEPKHIKGKYSENEKTADNGLINKNNKEKNSLVNGYNPDSSPKGYLTTNSLREEEKKPLSFNDNSNVSDKKISFNFNAPISINNGMDFDKFMNSVIEKLHTV